MKIKAGIRTLEEAEYFADGGAGEIYFGINGIPSHIKNPECNVNNASVPAIRKTIEYAHSRGCRMFVAVNEINAINLKTAIFKMRELMDCGLDGFIASSPEVVRNYPVVSPVPEWHLSSLAFCLNRAALDWYKSYGFSRFVIYQHFFPEESISFFANSGMESEVFFLSDDICVNMDGLCKGCTGTPGDGKKFCHRYYYAEGKKFHCRWIDIDTEIKCFYSYAKKAGWLKLVRLTDFSHRKKVFAYAKKLVAVAGRTDNYENFKKETFDIFKNMRRLRHEN